MYLQKSLWEHEANFFKASSYFEALIQDINSAESCIFIESYIFDLDLVGEKIFSALNQAKVRGVEIKVLVDGIGSMNSMEALLTKFQSAGIALKVYHPLPWNFRSYKYAVTKGAFFEKLLHFTGRINHRDHRKLCIVDRKIAWTGSFNISRTHLSKSAGGEGWKDHGVRVSGNKINLLAEEFLELWHEKASKKPKRPLPFILSTLNPAKRKEKVMHITQSIDSAKHRIWIANAYFAPHHSITAALVRAKQRGVDVRIIVGGKSDIVFFPSLTRSFYIDLLYNNIDVYEWRESILHSKIVLIDEYCYSGSTNLNNRSHYHDLELDILLCLENTIKEIEHQFETDFSKSKKIEHQYLNDNAIYIFLMSLFPKLLRYWL